METTIKSNQTKVNLRVANQTTTISNKTFWESVEFNRYGIISMIVLISGCLGGIAASFGAHGNVFELALIAFPTIICLAFILAVAPMRAILYLTSLAIILDLFVLIF